MLWIYVLAAWVVILGTWLTVRALRTLNEGRAIGEPHLYRVFRNGGEKHIPALLLCGVAIFSRSAPEARQAYQDPDENDHDQ